MIFVDTGAFIARFVASDEHHKSAVAVWNRLDASREVCVTSNLVIDETLSYLGRKTNYAYAASKGSLLYRSERLTLLRSTHEEELQALGYFEKYADQKVSFTDCVSFALMSKRRIVQCFSFDRHFAIAGFEFFT